MLFQNFGENHLKVIVVILVGTLCVRGQFLGQDAIVCENQARPLL